MLAENVDPGLWLSQGLAWRKRAPSGRAEEPQGSYCFLYGTRYSCRPITFVSLGFYAYYLWPLLLAVVPSYYPLSLVPAPGPLFLPL